MKWLQEVRRMGTTADKVAALTLLLQESAVSNLRSLDELLRWVSKRSGARAGAGQVGMTLSDHRCSNSTVQILPCIPLYNGTVEAQDLAISCWWR